MKTQTSNTSLLLRSLALIPVLALLVMSCGKKETEFIDGNPGDSNIPQQLVELVDSKITKNKTFLVDGEEFTAQQTIAKLEKFPNASIDYGLKYDEKAILNIYTNKTTSDEDLLNILNYAIEHTSGKKFSESAIPKYNKLAIKHKEYMDKNNSLIVWKDETEEMRNIFLSMTEEQRANNEPWPYLERVENCKPGEIPPPPPPVIESISISEKEIEEYNWLLDRHKEFLKDEKRIVIFKEDTNRMVYLYSQMSAEHQSKNKAWHYLYKYNAHKAAEILPPPPPPLKAEGYIKVDDRFYYYTTKAGDKNLYDRNGKVIDIKGKKVTQVEQSDLPPPPPPAKLKSGTSINFQHNEPNQSDKDEKGYLRKGIAYRVNEQNELSSTFEANMDDNQKKELDYRLNIMRASQRAEDKINYIVEGKSAQLDDAYTFVYQNPLSHVEVYENANEILTLDFAKSDNPMSTSELQLVYMKVFEKYKPNSSLFND